MSQFITCQFWRWYDTMNWFDSCNVNIYCQTCIEQPATLNIDLRFGSPFGWRINQTTSQRCNLQLLCIIDLLPDMGNLTNWVVSKGFNERVLYKHVDRYYVLQKQDSSFGVIDSLTPYPLTWSHLPLHSCCPSCNSGLVVHPVNSPPKIHVNEMRLLAATNGGIVKPHKNVHLHGVLRLGHGLFQSCFVGWQ